MDQSYDDRYANGSTPAERIAHQVYQYFDVIEAEKERTLDGNQKPFLPLAQYEGIIEALEMVTALIEDELHPDPCSHCKTDISKRRNDEETLRVLKRFLLT